MRHLTQAELRHLEARCFARIMAAVARGADQASPLGQRDSSRKGTAKGEMLIARRDARRNKTIRSLFHMRAVLS